MEITPELIRSILTVVIIVIIVVFIAKKLFKLAIVCAAILLIFNVGFLLDGTELRKNLNMDSWLSSEAADNVENFFNDFASKRDEYGVIDADAVYDDVVTGIEKGTVMVIEGLGYLNVPAFAESIASGLTGVGVDEVDWSDMAEQINERMGGKLTQSQIDDLIAQIRGSMDASQAVTTTAVVTAN